MRKAIAKQQALAQPLQASMNLHALRCMLPAAHGAYSLSVQALAAALLAEASAHERVVTWQELVDRVMASTSLLEFLAQAVRKECRHTGHSFCSAARLYAAVSPTRTVLRASRELAAAGLSAPSAEVVLQLSGCAARAVA